MKRVTIALTAFALGVGSLVGCNSLQSAAQRDPMKCERGAKCDKRHVRFADCSEQCSDDPACMSRCEQVQAPNGGLGH
jgi:hypothetical protein